jgi:quercetin dioxygenase-like cupin family protein
VTRNRRRQPVHDTTIKKVSSAYSPKGPMGQVYLVSGKRVAMRLWHEEPASTTKPHAREYETVGYAIRGKAKLYLEGQVIIIEAGDAWLVPAGAVHHYEVLETFDAVEATAPPAHIAGRDRA